MSQLDILSDYSKKELLEIPESILRLSNLRMLYLEGNFLKTLPDNFFALLPNLTWLDIRNNQLVDIPSTICDHKNLQTLLLQNNQLEFLPNEIGLIPTLQMLQVSGNPILYPPQEVLDGGTYAICTYLKSQFDKIMETNDERMKESEISLDRTAFRGSTTSTSKASLSSVEPPKPSPRSATLSMATLPIITVKSLSKSKPPEEISSKKSNEKQHKVSRYCPKFTVKSQYVNGNKTIQTVMKFKAKAGGVDGAVLKEIWLNKLKEILADQERLIQQEKNLKSLNNWRQQKKMEPARLPSEEEFSIPPFATEDDYDRILSKDDLRKHLQKIGRMTETPKTPANIDRLMDDVLSQLKVIEHRMSDTNTPRTRIRSSENEIKAILELHKKIAALQLLNNTC